MGTREGWLKPVELTIVVSNMVIEVDFGIYELSLSIWQTSSENVTVIDTNILGVGVERHDLVGGVWFSGSFFWRFVF